MPDLNIQPNPNRLTQIEQLRKAVNNRKVFADLSHHTSDFEELFFDGKAPYLDVKRARLQIEPNLILGKLAAGITLLTSDEQELTTFHKADFVIKVPPNRQLFHANPQHNLYNIPNHQNPSKITTYYAFYREQVIGQTVDSDDINDALAPSSRFDIPKQVSIHRYLFQPNSYVLQTLSDLIKHDPDRKIIHNYPIDPVDTSPRQLAVDPLLARKIQSGYFNSIILLDDLQRSELTPRLSGLMNKVYSSINLRKPLGLQILDPYYHSPIKYLSNADLIVELIQKYNQDISSPLYPDVVIDELSYIYAFFGNQVLIEVINSHSHWSKDDNRFKAAPDGYITNTLYEANADLLKALFHRLNNKSKVDFGSFKRDRFQAASNTK